MDVICILHSHQSPLTVRLIVSGLHGHRSSLPHATREMRAWAWAWALAAAAALLLLDAASAMSPMHGTQKRDRLMASISCYNQNKMHDEEMKLAAEDEDKRPAPTTGSPQEFCSALVANVKGPFKGKTDQEFEDQCVDVAGDNCRWQCKWLMSLFSDGPWTPTLTHKYEFNMDDCVLCLESRGGRCEQPR